MNNLQNIVLRIIKDHKGDSNKLTQYEITDNCIAISGENITNREVRRIILDLIRQGNPVVSTPKGGYFWQEKEEEAIECCNRLRRKAVKIMLRAKWIKRNSRQGQQKLFDVIK